MGGRLPNFDDIAARFRQTDVQSRDCGSSPSKKNHVECSRPTCPDSRESTARSSVSSWICRIGAQFLIAGASGLPSTLTTTHPRLTPALSAGEPGSMPRHHRDAVQDANIDSRRCRPALHPRRRRRKPPREKSRNGSAAAARASPASRRGPVHRRLCRFSGGISS